MANDFDAQVIPSLLDRLTDHDVDAQHEPPLSRSQGLRALKASLWRDLNALLNTKRRDQEVPDEFPEVNRSLMTYGLPDFTAYSLKNPSDQNRLRRAIETAIRRFEPRLQSVTVTLEPRGEFDPTVRFRVDALLRVDPVPEPVSFDTVLQADTCRIVVMGENR